MSVDVTVKVECDECGVEIQYGALACKNCFDMERGLTEEARKERDDLQDEVDQKKREIIGLENEIRRLETELIDAVKEAEARRY